MKLKKALSQIRPSAEQREKIYGGILRKLEEEAPAFPCRKAFPKRRISIAAAVCALVLVCGITVSAVANLDWVKSVLGNDISLIEKNIGDYSVEIGNVKIENAEGLDCKFTIGDVISDGSTILINIIAEDKPGELQWDHQRACPGGALLTEESSFYGSHYTSEWEETGRTDNTISTAVIMCFKDKLKKGDILEFKLTNHSMKNDFLTPEEAKNWKSNLATVSFEIMSGVNNMKKTVQANQTAAFINRPFPEDEKFTAAFDETKITPLKVNIDTIAISPFSFEITGTVLPKQYCTGLHGYGNIWLVYKNGEKICIVPVTTKWNAKDGSVVMTGDFSSRSLGADTGVIDLNEIEAIEFDGFTVPFE
ncbi:MAG: DUF4179 domain-containing protein [Prevotella sp.]|nr:DUF4179 domain-containing protein [Prevotella sp.]